MAYDITQEPPRVVEADRQIGRSVERLREISGQDVQHAIRTWWFGEVYFGEEDGVLFLRHHERGQRVLDERFATVGELVEHVVALQARWAAQRYESEHRREGEDSRRQWFTLLARWLDALDPAWGRAERERQAAILEVNPFVDDRER
ncbi:Imm63 family immunity protein [Ornithinimicrobium sp. Y1847]|uniref:Imm63 family immunity protein n=1 Tax=Ornithinimicrobium sp. Y1847 TaxID=3405419 RepID=UPI003B676D4E